MSHLFTRILMLDDQLKASYKEIERHARLFDKYEKLSNKYLELSKEETKKMKVFNFTKHYNRGCYYDAQVTKFINDMQEQHAIMAKIAKENMAIIEQIKNLQ